MRVYYTWIVFFFISSIFFGRLFCALVLLLSVIIFGKRSACHYFCPISLFNITGTKITYLFKIPSFKLTADYDKCIGCGKCNKACTMSLNIKEMVKLASK